MIGLDLVPRLPTAAVATTAGPPPALPGWMLPVVVVVAALCWYLHRRWRTGRYFMSRFTTPEQEAAKFAGVGYVFLPAAITCTATVAMLTLWTVFGLVANLWFASLFLALGAVVAVAGGWTIKEFWSPSERRTPEWARRL